MPELHGDSAYHGYHKEHPNIDYPYKKPKGGSPGEEENKYNKGLGRFRNPRRTHVTKVSIIGGIVIEGLA